jgi:SAM-dependent methyltransferase
MLKTIVACRDCGLEFSRHIPPGGFDAYFGIFDVPASYERTYVSRECPVHDAAWVADQSGRLDRLLAEDGFEARAQAAGGTAYEIGCGSGALLELLRRRGWRVRGGDAGEQCVAAARSLGLDVERRAASALGEITERFDLVVAIYLLEHVESPRTLLADCAALLKPQGRILFEAPLRVADPVIRESARFGYGIYGHTYFFSAADVRALVQRAGLHLVREDRRLEDNFDFLAFTATRSHGETAVQ